MRAWLVLVLLATTGCATRRDEPTLPVAGGPLHDFAREWENPGVKRAAAKPKPKRRRPAS